MNWIFKQSSRELIRKSQLSIRIIRRNRRQRRILMKNKPMHSNIFALSVQILKGNCMHNGKDKHKKRLRSRLNQATTCSGEICPIQTTWSMERIRSKEVWESGNCKTCEGKHLNRSSWTLSGRWSSKRSRLQSMPPWQSQVVLSYQSQTCKVHAE